jgi:hypothetical protein
MTTGIVVACGPSLKKVDPAVLGRDVGVVGTNDSFLWAGHLDWLCIINRDWWERYPAMLMHYDEHGRLIVLERKDRPIPIGKRAPSNKGQSYFSFDVNEGFYTGNVTSFALQWAVHIGLNPIYILGLDLKGAHGTCDRPSNALNLKKQLVHFQEASVLLKEKGIQVYNCNPDSACEAFEYKELP